MQRLLCHRVMAETAFEAPCFILKGIRGAGAGSFRMALEGRCSCGGVSRTGFLPDRTMPACGCASLGSGLLADGAMRRWLNQAGATDGAVLLLRVWLGAMMLWHGVPKFGRMEAFQERVAGMGFPAPEMFAWAAALSETLGGVALLLGIGMRLLLPFVCLTMLVAAFGAHAADPFARKELPLTYAVVAAALWMLGAGRWSLEQWLKRRRDAQ